MKKRSLLLSAVFLFSLFLASCSATGGIPALDNGTQAESAPAPYPSSAPSTAPMEPSSGGKGGLAADSSTGGTSIPQNAKLILRASLAVESTAFDKAVTALDQLVAGQGGYYENNEIQQGAYYDTRAARYGSFTVRVPQKNFDAFLNAAGSIGHVVSSSKSSEDVGEAYYDTEARLKTQQTKHERLLALLEKADNMENIIALETALSDVEYQIEQLTGTLRRYDSLVDYATITVRLDEVLTITEQPKETATFGGRVSNAFKGGVDDLGRSLSDLAVWAAYNFVGVLFFLAIAAAALVVGTRAYRRRHPKTVPIKEAHKEQEKE